MSKKSKSNHFDMIMDNSSIMINLHKTYISCNVFQIRKRTIVFKAIHIVRSKRYNMAWHIDGDEENFMFCLVLCIALLHDIIYSLITASIKVVL